ncbi:uncharacterized protein LOC111615293 [Centruroides sculpturatus]|uniref:uncharacterized protein LOC111615293 n=1 Tax=Centruroides sculpturatus TaxID=218467 RepID=UPI000C6E671F|nr:uncharacterized protein LOC111615293 [Centruroides sculpturatus]
MRCNTGYYFPDYKQKKKFQCSYDEITEEWTLSDQIPQKCIISKKIECDIVKGKHQEIICDHETYKECNATCNLGYLFKDGTRTATRICTETGETNYFPDCENVCKTKKEGKKQSMKCEIHEHFTFCRATCNEGYQLESGATVSDKICSRINPKVVFGDCVPSD